MSRSRSHFAISLMLPTLLLMGGCDDASADDEKATPLQSASASNGKNAARLANKSDGNWISISGKVISATPGSFLLDYGQGNVTVEMDDWDWYQEGGLLRRGDDVVVTGRVDNDLLVNKKIEASGVYVKNLGTYFYASGADEESLPVSNVYIPDVPSSANFTGTVTAVEGREFTLTAANGAMRVDTSSLRDNPLDQEGFQKIKVGDRVYAWGDLDLESAESSELKARGIISLSRDRSKQSTS